MTTLGWLAAAGSLWAPFGQAKVAPEPSYLGFQIFTGAPDPKIALGDSGTGALGAVPTAAALRTVTQDIVRRIGTVGGGMNRLAVVLGPISFDHSDSEVTKLISDGFDLAIQENVAVGFHVDDSMFWARRRDLTANPANVEWRDWKGTPSTGRSLFWGPKPLKVAPQMCLNSKLIQAEVKRRGTEVIGRAILAGIDRLRKVGKADRFAGVIVGWETQIGLDFDTQRPLGYHSLVNRGFSAGHPPPDIDREREAVVQEFIELWSKSVSDAGVSPARIYSHTAFISRTLFDQQSPRPASYSQANFFAPPGVAFGKSHRPGFSTYPQPGLMEQIYAEVARHGGTPWASSEGTNVQPGGQAGDSGMGMETYLGRMFNHGAALVTLFSWGVGGEAGRNSNFRIATEGAEALTAYRKFLKGERLTEIMSPNEPFQVRLPRKIQKIQAELPAWIQRTGRQAEVEPLMKELDAALKANNFREAEKVADQILRLVGS